MIKIDNAFKNKRVLITGGLGFMGTHLSRRLDKIGAQVTIIEPYIGDAHLRFLNDYKRVKVIKGDIRDENLMNSTISGQDYLFHLAGRSGSVSSLKESFKDLDLNCKGLLTVLEACRRNNPSIKIIFPSSRLKYGRPVYLPVNEKHPTEPLCIYGAHKLICEKYLSIYSKIYNIKYTILTISNPYGPFFLPLKKSYGVINWFIQQAMQGKTIKLFGGGAQKRDYIFMDDLINCFLITAYSDKANNQIFNVGGKKPMRIREAVKIIIDIIGRGNIENVEWDEEYLKVETGDYFADMSKISSMLGWSPSIDFEEGSKKTILAQKEIFKKNERT